MLFVSTQQVYVRTPANCTHLPANQEGETLGYVAEEPRGLFSMWSRQLFRTHRPFRALVMDSSGSPVLWVRPNLFLPGKKRKLMVSLKG